jgi:hypothetical protein
MNFEYSELANFGAASFSGHHNPIHSDRNEFNEFNDPHTADLVNSLISQDVAPPILSPLALHGVVGQIVRKIEPHSETHPASLLVQIIVGFGNMIGRAPYFVTERDKQHTNLFAVIVGDSSRARKGTSWGHAKHILAQVDAPWSGQRIMSGVASGEGVIGELRDEENEEAKYRRDKRMMLVEGEFAQVLRVCERPGNTLSPLLRNAWDSGYLRNMSKGSPLRASDCHISMIGHITRKELRTLLSENDSANGFGNRILWAHSSRTKYLPDGGDIDREDFSSEIQDLKMAAKLAREAGEIKRNEEAREYWHTIYPKLGNELPGITGSLTSRAEAQVVRLALLFCLLDRERLISLAHLQAAEALWNYCRDSARWAFNDKHISANAVRILKALNHSETRRLTRSQIVKHVFSNNISSENLDSIIGEIIQLIKIEKTKDEGGKFKTVYCLL